MVCWYRGYAFLISALTGYAFFLLHLINPSETIPNLWRERNNFAPSLSFSMFVPLKSLELPKTHSPIRLRYRDNSISVNGWFNKSGIAKSNVAIDKQAEEIPDFLWIQFWQSLLPTEYAPNLPQLGQPAFSSTWAIYCSYLAATRNFEQYTAQNTKNDRLYKLTTCSFLIINIHLSIYMKIHISKKAKWLCHLHPTPFAKPSLTLPVHA